MFKRLIENRLYVVVGERIIDGLAFSAVLHKPRLFEYAKLVRDS